MSNRYMRAMVALSIGFAGCSSSGTDSAGAASGGTGADADASATPISDASDSMPDAGPNIPATGTFPPVDDLSAKGPFTDVRENATGPSSGYTLYYPEQAAPDGQLNPVVTWGNGGFTSPADYDYLLPHLASHGFVVIAANNTVVTGAEVRAGLDWLAEQNEDASSPLYERLDMTNAAGVGYSNGGLAVLNMADDPRLVTLVIISGANMNDAARAIDIPKMHTPTAYLCTADSASSGNCAGDYAMATVPAFFGVMIGSAHTDVTELLNLGVPEIMERLTIATTAWLRWQQMADATRETMFLGADCGLCTDPNWTVEDQKNW